MASELKRAENFWKHLHFSPNSSKLRSYYLFSFQKRTDYLFPAFSRSEYSFPKSATPPPPPFRIKWSSPKLSRPLPNFKLCSQARSNTVHAITSIDQILHQLMILLPNLTSYDEVDADRPRLFLRTPGLAQFWTLKCSTCWDQSYLQIGRDLGIWASNIHITSIFWGGDRLPFAIPDSLWTDIWIFKNNFLISTKMLLCPDLELPHGIFIVLVIRVSICMSVDFNPVHANNKTFRPKLL